MRHPNNRGDRKLAANKARQRVEQEERYDSGRKERPLGPDFNPANRDRKAAKQRERAWRMVAGLLPAGAEELSLNELALGGSAAGHDKYVRF